MSPGRVLTTSELTIDLGRLVDNYRSICTHVGPDVVVAAMVKADAYGLGVIPVAEVLSGAGCERFFVAQVSEGTAVRSVLPNAHVCVLNGPMPGTEDELIRGRLEPVINSLDQLALWVAAARDHATTPPATLHFDTGMSRLGMSAAEAATLRETPSLTEGVHVSHVMSHLASADEPSSTQSEQQLADFLSLRAAFPNATASLANSPGVFLDPRYRFDMVRAGVALYGGSPVAEGLNPMKQVVSLEAPIVQIRDVRAGEAIGYGATHTVERDGRLAIVSLGYADGFLRAGSNRGIAYIGSTPLPIVGRVSMDLITLDVTEVPDDQLWLGAPVELIGDQATLDAVAQAARTIPHEILVDLGARMQRTFVGR